MCRHNRYLGWIVRRRANIKNQHNFRLQQRLGGIIQLPTCVCCCVSLLAAGCRCLAGCNKRFVARRKDNHTFNRDLSLLQAKTCHQQTTGVPCCKKMRCLYCFCYVVCFFFYNNCVVFVQHFAASCWCL